MPLLRGNKKSYRFGNSSGLSSRKVSRSVLSDTLARLTQRLIPRFLSFWRAAHILSSVGEGRSDNREGACQNEDWSTILGWVWERLGNVVADEGNKSFTTRNVTKIDPVWNSSVEGRRSRRASLKKPPRFLREKLPLHFEWEPILPDRLLRGEGRITGDFQGKNFMTLKKRSKPSPEFPASCCGWGGEGGCRESVRREKRGG